MKDIVARGEQIRRLVVNGKILDRGDSRPRDPAQGEDVGVDGAAGSGTRLRFPRTGSERIHAEGWGPGRREVDWDRVVGNGTCL